MVVNWVVGFVGAKPEMENARYLLAGDSEMENTRYLLVGDPKMELDVSVGGDGSWWLTVASSWVAVDRVEGGDGERKEGKIWGRKRLNYLL
jgi:hypothetical protein